MPAQMPNLCKIIVLAGGMEKDKSIFVPHPDMLENHKALTIGTDPAGRLNVNSLRSATDWFGTAAYERDGMTISDIDLYFEVGQDGEMTPVIQVIESPYGKPIMFKITEHEEAAAFAEAWDKLIGETYLPMAKELAEAGKLGQMMDDDEDDDDDDEPGPMPLNFDTAAIRRTRPSSN